MARFKVLRAPAAQEFGPEDDVSRFVPGAAINFADDAAARWVRRGVLTAAATRAARAAAGDDNGGGGDDDDGDGEA